MVQHPDFTASEAVGCVCGRRTAWHMDKLLAIGEWNENFGLKEETIKPGKIEV